MKVQINKLTSASFQFETFQFVLNAYNLFREKKNVELNNIEHEVEIQFPAHNTKQINYRDMESLDAFFS